MIDKIFVFISGAITGSFLNVCIYRMPFGKSVVWPRSHCPLCEKKIPWYDNIPFLSYLLLRGRCRFCNGKISVRYLAVELLTALAFLVFYNHFGFNFYFVYYTFFTCGLIIATFVDIGHRIIPDEISVGGIIAGFLLSIARGFVNGSGHQFKWTLADILRNPPPVLDSLLGILIGGGIIYYTGKAFDWFYFKLLKRPPIQGETESMGGGDVKLLAMIGAFLGWQKVLLTFFLAPFLGVIIGIINLITKKDHTIPYGPFLSAAALLSVFYADKIISLIFFLQ